MIDFQFTLIIYYLTFTRQELVLVHTLIYIHSNIYFLKIYPLILRISSGSNLCKDTLTFILLPLPVHDPVGETSNALHHFQSPFSQNV